MSTSYNLEPQPTAKVLLQTSSGDLLLELFAKQTPLASRNFLQLCLDGYYTDTIFHRVVSGFIIQGGDPTGTGEGGTSIYDSAPFADEFHSRLKFNRRGLLGMANAGKKDDNGSQFFFTLAKTEELNGKHTLFGRVVGDTIYNLMRMAEAELVEGSERPLYPTRILGAEVLVNPFEGMMKMERMVSGRVQGEEKRRMNGRKRKVGGKKTLLSFGGDEEGDAVLPVSKKPKFNTKLVTAQEEQGVNLKTEAGGVKEPELKKIVKREPSPAAAPRTIKPTQPPQSGEAPPHPRIKSSPSSSLSREPSPPTKNTSSVLDKTNAQIAELKASMKRTISGPSTSPSTTTKRKSALEEMIPETSIRGRKRRQQTNGDKDLNGYGNLNREDKRALEMFNAFRAKLDHADNDTSRATGGNEEEGEAENTLPPTSSKPKDDRQRGEEDGEEENLCDLHFIVNCQSCRSWDDDVNIESKSGNTKDEDHNDTGWMAHSLSFAKDRLGKDLAWKKKNEEELVVIDPREKGNEIKELRKGQVRR
ncbi:MAG: Peptidyl-prolyl isomerase cwc27 [Peltula sp. TS41687]|nr:MAG: Peptidyl-prolyl isomerase cwc27 [Peltula sp. TS41687]